jgi:hypothetical protein
MRHPTSGRIRFLGALLLEIPRGLLASLRNLTIGIGGDEHVVGELLHALVRELATSVVSYRGLQLTITRHGFPVVLTAFADEHDGDLVTSLRVPLVLVGSGFAADNRVVFYAGMPGAFVDLAADLTLALDRRARKAQRADKLAPSAIRLDADPPPASRAFTLSGVAELGAIDRAVGVMIEQGHHPDWAYASLRKDAARAGMEPYTWAVRILQGTQAQPG